MFSSLSKELHRLNYRLNESICTIITDNPEALDIAVSAIKRHRINLEKFIQKTPTFQFALEPVVFEEGPKVVKLMVEASRHAKVGPMAAVAGVLSDLAVMEMLETGAEVAVVENGGEASVISNKPIDIAIQAGEIPLSKRVGFRLEKFPIGVATSSGLFSHALSFGEAEAATVFAENAGIADAAATAVANIVKGNEEEKIIEEAVALGLSIKGVQGVFILYREFVGLGGEVPTIINVDPDDDKFIGKES
jgi:ApbE superfamily uncharacterized protein (UPF0280 family)